jgi:hypothetical protein
MPIMKLEGQTIVKQTIVLEEVWLVNCVLSECVIFYSGGPYRFENANFDRCHWNFEGAAKSTCQLLSFIGFLRQPEASIQMTSDNGPLN